MHRTNKHKVQQNITNHLLGQVRSFFGGYVSPYFGCLCRYKQNFKGFNDSEFVTFDKERFEFVIEYQLMPSVNSCHHTSQHALWSPKALSDRLNHIIIQLKVQSKRITTIISKSLELRCLGRTTIAVGVYLTYKFIVLKHILTRAAHKNTLNIFTKLHTNVLTFPRISKRFQQWVSRSPAHSPQSTGLSSLSSCSHFTFAPFFTGTLYKTLILNYIVVCIISKKRVPRSTILAGGILQYK